MRKFELAGVNCISGPFPCKAIKRIVWKGTKT